LAEIYPEPEKIKVSNEESLQHLFRGINFVITGLVPNVKENTDSPNLSEEIQKAITKMGGTIVNTIVKKTQKRQTEENRPSCVLIAPNALRTIKYMLGLAARVPCLHYNWVVFCYKRTHYIDPTSFILPAGTTIRKTLKKLIRRWLQIFHQIRQNLPSLMPKKKLR